MNENLSLITGHKSRYMYEMTDEQHRELADVLHNVKGKVAVSGYHCSLMQEVYGDWQLIEAPAKVCHSTKGVRTEVLWVNYEPEKGNKNALNNTQELQTESQCPPHQISLF